MGFTVQQCAQIYAAIMDNTYRLTLENNMIIDIRFKKEQFKHLIGIHKLTDIRGLPEKDAKLLFKEIYSGVPSLLRSIQKSVNYDKIVNRVNSFYFLPTLLHGKIIIDFDPRLVDGETKLRNTEFILYNSLNDGYAHLTIGEGIDSYYPETFFFEPTKKYISRQKLVDIIKTEITS